MVYPFLFIGTLLTQDVYKRQMLHDWNSLLLAVWHQLLQPLRDHYLHRILLILDLLIAQTCQFLDGGISVCKSDGYAIIKLSLIHIYQNDAIVFALLCLTAAMMIYALLRYFLIFLKILHSGDPKDSIDLELKAKREPNMKK